MKLHQVASQALKEFIHHMEDKVPATPRPASVVIVRHPLARLVSAYRLLVPFFRFVSYMPSNMFYH